MSIRPLFLLVLAGCGLDPSYFPDTSGTFLARPDLGFSVTEFDEWGPSARRSADGSIEYFGEAKVTLRFDDARQVEALGLVAPVAAGGRRSLATVDLTTGDERVFSFDVEEGAVVFGDFEGGVFVLANGDGSYGVYTGRFDGPLDPEGFEHASDGYEAWRLVQGFNTFSDTSRHALALAYAMSQMPLVQARTYSVCELPYHCTSRMAEEDPATNTRICSIFSEFCVCLLCEISAERGDDCLPCD